MDKSEIRKQVFDVIVRQALAGVPWRSMCKQLMDSNGISEEEIEAAVVSKTSVTSHTNSPDCQCRDCLISRVGVVSSIEALWEAMPHESSGICKCKSCMHEAVEMRHQIEKQCYAELKDFELARVEACRRIDALPHSDTPPCACTACWGAPAN